MDYLAGFACVADEFVDEEFVDDEGVVLVFVSTGTGTTSVWTGVVTGSTIGTVVSTHGAGFSIQLPPPSQYPPPQPPFQPPSPQPP